MMKDKKKLVVFTVIILFVAAVFFIGKAFLGKKTKVAPSLARPVQTALAAQQDVPIRLDSFGSLYSYYNVDVKSQVTGQIQDDHFNEGQEVKKGDLLFTIDPSTFKAQLEKAEAALAQDTADLNLKKDTLERNKKLFETQLISQQDFDKIQADVANAEARIKVDQAEIDMAKINLGYCSITSPIDGITGKCQVDPGNIVSANNGPVLVNIKTIDPLYVDFTLPETELVKVRSSMDKGQLEVEVTLQGDEGNKYAGTLELIGNTVDISTGTMSLRAVVPNKERKLWPGQFVRVRLILGTEEKATLVPYEAVQLGQKGSYLFVVTADNKADLRLVTTGQQVDDDIVIKEGVQPAEKVVISGQMGLSPGVSVAEVKNEPGR